MIKFLKDYKRIVIPFTCLLLIITFSAKPANAEARRTVQIHRGNSIVYCKSTVTWTYTGSYVKESDAWQSIKGMGVQDGGTQKLRTSDSRVHYWNCKTKFLAGAVVKGITIGYQKDWIDQAIIRYNGSYSIREDIG